MSRFSERCKKLLLENETTAYRISKNSGLELTSVQRMITGKRLPHISFVKDFCRALRIPHAEEQKLLNLYHIEQLGEDKYKSYQSVLSLLSSLNAFAKSKPEKYSDSFNLAPPRPKKLCSTVDNHFYKSELLIRSVLFHAFSSEAENYIYTNIPVSDATILHQILLLHNQYPDHTPKVYHLLNFQMSTSLAYKNIQALQQILPLSLSQNIDYKVYYYYSKMTENDFPQLLFPFYLITANGVLELSADLQSTVLHTDKEIIRQFTCQFQKSCAISAPLLQKHNLPDTAFEAQQVDASGQAGYAVHEIQYQPCYAHMIAQSLFKKKVQDFIPKMLPLANVVLPNFYATVQNLQSCFFSKEGIQCFCQTGKFHGQIASFLPALTKEERKRAIQSFYHSLLADDTPIHLMVKDYIRLPDNICFEFVPNHVLQITQVNSISDIAICILNESNICNTFMDFMQYLRGSDLVYTKEETLQFLSTILESI